MRSSDMGVSSHNSAGRISRHAFLNLCQDCMLSSIASVATLLLLRWLTAPIPHFSVVLLIWTATAFLFTVIGSLVSGSHKTVKRCASVKSVSSRLGTISLKATLLSVLLSLFGHFVHADKASSIVVIVIADSAFTAFALYLTLVVNRSIAKHSDVDIRKAISRSNALVFGSADDALLYANRVAADGRFNVLGLLSDNPDDSGLVVGDYVVYYAKDASDISALSWRLGGIDCVLFPSFDSHENGDGHLLPPEMHADSMSVLGRILKRSFDFLLSLILVLVFMPLGLICALAVRLEDGGPVFYRQERVGLNGKPFHILKFRSMRTDAECSGPQLYSGDDDSRLTRVGAFLRSHHLDELPQLLNVLSGDMSFVGYRPERPFYIEQILQHNPRYCYLYQLRPGVTSYATLYNGYTDSLEKMLTRLDLDLYYLRHHSVMFDLKVLWLTFFSIVSGKKF